MGRSRGAGTTVRCVGMVVALWGAGGSSAMAAGEADWRQRLAAMDEVELKTSYLRCAEVSAERLLTPAEATACQLAADRLRERHFGGSFERLIAWWQQRRQQPLAANR